jgi:hypothetical protein
MKNIVRISTSILLQQVPHSATSQGSTELVFVVFHHMTSKFGDLFVINKVKWDHQGKRREISLHFHSKDSHNHAESEKFLLSKEKKRAKKKEIVRKTT